ncbi:MAG: hypothetical protein JO056_12910 [Alphaproteobacteria bacterium]|nr:hypothetical protein [Alphaproteobacteria bacterium]
MTREQIEAVLDDVRSWPKQDQEELAGLARDIQARRSGVYITSDEEREAVARAQTSPLIPEDEVDRFWKARGIG